MGSTSASRTVEQERPDFVCAFGVIEMTICPGLHESDEVDGSISVAITNRMSVVFRDGNLTASFVVVGITGVFFKNDRS